jgi:hypothetical protein
MLICGCFAMYASVVPVCDGWRYNARERNVSVQA